MTLSTIRWLLVPVAGFAGWFGALFLGMMTLSVVEGFVADPLGNDFPVPHLDAFVTIFTGLSGILVVLFPAFIAPEQKGGVAVLAYLIGATWATYFVLLNTSLWPPYLAAILAGLVTVMIAVKRWSVPDSIEEKPV